jgi:hypothetical protein
MTPLCNDARIHGLRDKEQEWGPRNMVDGRNAPVAILPTGSGTESCSGALSDLAPLRVEGQALHPIAFCLELRRGNATVSALQHGGVTSARRVGAHLREHREACATPASYTSTSTVGRRIASGFKETWRWEGGSADAVRLTYSRRLLGGRACGVHRHRPRDRSSIAGKLSVPPESLRSGN